MIKKILTLLVFLSFGAFTLNATTLNQLKNDGINKPIMVIVSQDHCKYCKKLKAAIKGDRELINLIKSKFQFLEINKSRVPVPMELTIRGAPTTFILTADGQIVHKIEGYRSAKGFKKEIEASLNEIERRRR